MNMNIRHCLKRKGKLCPGWQAQSYIRNTDVTLATSLDSANVGIHVFMTFCMRADSFIV